MSENIRQPSKRCLATIESNLVKAEEAFADADARFKEADRDRRAALENINQHQSEMDLAIAELRQHSFPGTKWRIEHGEGEEALELHSEDIVRDEERESVPSDDVELASEATKKAFTKDFELLKASAQPSSDDPVLKVVSSPKG